MKIIQIDRDPVLAALSAVQVLQGSATKILVSGGCQLFSNLSDRLFASKLWTNIRGSRWVSWRAKSFSPNVTLTT